MQNTLYDYYNSKGQTLPSVQDRTATATQAGISGYSGTGEQNKQLLKYLQSNTGATGTTVPTTINASSISTTKPLQVPPVQTTPNQNLSNELLLQQTQDQTAVANSEKDKNSTVSTLQNLQSQLSGQTADVQSLENQQGLPTMNKDLLDLQNTSKMQTAKYLQGLQDIELQGGNAVVVNAKAGYLNRQNAIDAMLTNSLISAKQGNIQTAQAQVDRAISLKYDPIKQQLENQKMFLDMNYKDLSRADQKLADAKKTELDLKLKQVESDAQNQKDINAIKLEVAKNGAPVGILSAMNNAKTVDEALSISKGYLANGLDQQIKQAQLNKLRSENAQGAGSTGSSTGSVSGDVTDILSGRNTMFNIRQTMGRTNKAAAYMQSIRDQIRKIDPNFDFVASDAGGKSVSTGYVQKATSAINSVLPNIDKIVGLSDQVNRVGWKGIDNLLQKGEIQFNGKSVSNFHEAQKLIADEIGIALGAGTVSDMKLQLGFDVTDPSVSKEVFASNMGIVKDFINNRKQGLQDLRYKSSTSGQTPKDDMSDPTFVEKALTNQGLRYTDVVTSTPKGQIPVLLNSSGQVGFIPEKEFTSSTYTRI